MGNTSTKGYTRVYEKTQTKANHPVQYRVTIMSSMVTTPSIQMWMVLPIENISITERAPVGEAAKNGTKKHMAASRNACKTNRNGDAQPAEHYPSTIIIYAFPNASSHDHKPGCSQNIHVHVRHGVAQVAPYSDFPSCEAIQSATALIS
jgi:hypothetical protein